MNKKIWLIVFISFFFFIINAKAESLTCKYGLQDDDLRITITYSSGALGGISASINKDYHSADASAIGATNFVNSDNKIECPKAIYVTWGFTNQNRTKLAKLSVTSREGAEKYGRTEPPITDDDESADEPVKQNCSSNSCYCNDEGTKCSLLRNPRGEYNVSSPMENCGCPSSPSAPSLTAPFNLECDYSGNIIKIANGVISVQCGDHCKGVHSLKISDFLDANNKPYCPSNISCYNSSYNSALREVTRTCGTKEQQEAVKNHDNEKLKFDYLSPLHLGKLSCDTVFKNNDGTYNNFYYLFWNVLKIMKYAAIGLTLGLSLMDFIKVISSGDKDELKKATNRSIKRLIIGVIIFFVPTLLNFVLNIIGDYTTCNLL